MEKTVEIELLEPVMQAVPFLIRFPTDRIMIDFDREADVLYISLERPQKSTHSEMTDDGILMNYRDDRLVGITVLNASMR